MLKVVLADDHDVVRKGVKSAINEEPDIQVVAEASDGLSVEPTIQAHNPDILIVDVMMPGLSGLEVVRQIVKKYSAVRVIVFSMYANQAYVREAFRNGAQGYVLKGSSIDDIVDAIRSVNQGISYLSDGLGAIESVMAHLQDTGSLDAYNSLTNRERQILQLSAEGRSSGEIGAILNISPRTVETHRTNLMRKLNFTNQSDLIRLAIRKGLIPLDK